MQNLSNATRELTHYKLWECANEIRALLKHFFSRIKKICHEFVPTRKARISFAHSQSIVFFLSLAWLTGAASAQFSPQVGQPGAEAIHYTDARFQGWATGAWVWRGPAHIAQPELGQASFGCDENALGAAFEDNPYGVVSLGDGGMALLSFDQPITNGEGADFAVFENGFLAGMPGMAYLELAQVWVSSDGENFFAFPSTSLTPFEAQVDPFGLLDKRLLNNLAGGHIGGWGTPFDLAELEGASDLLDVNNVLYVLVQDVVGSIDPQYATLDSQGNPINDPWPTSFASSGFDLDGVGVIHQSL